MGRGTLPLDAGNNGTAVNATEADAPPTVADSDMPETILRFRIDGPLGSGGMADVFRAYDPMLERPVALKVLRAKQADDRRRRTLREARAAAALAHPNIITIYEVEEADGVVVIAMELLEGRVLRQAMAEPLPLATKLRWLLEMASALAAAHARGLVHRDVKPDNAFVCTSGPLKLLDFGIAKRSEAADAAEPGSEDDAPSSMATVEGRRLGTPRYMAPEQHLGASTDARTDQHAWGLVAFELFTGRHGAAEIPTVAEGLARTEPNGAGERGKLLAQVVGLPAPVAAAVLRALAPAKEDRFPSMAPIIAVLDDALRSPASSDATTGASAVPKQAAPRRARWPWLAAAGLVVAAGATYAIAQQVATKKVAAAPAPVIARCHATNARAYPRGEAPGAGDSLAMLPPLGELVSFRPNKASGMFCRERAGKLDPFDPFPGFDYAKGAIFGGAIKNEPALLVTLNTARSSFTFWSEEYERRAKMGVVSGRSLPQVLTHTATTQAFGDMFAVTVGVSPAEGGQMAGVFTAFSAVGSRPDNVVAVRPGESLEYPSAAGLPDRLAATYSTAAGITFTYFDRLGYPSGPLVPVTTLDPAAANGGEERVPLMSALALQPQAMSVYWLDRRSLGQLWVATANAAGDAFGAKRAVLKESFSAVQPLVAALPDGRSTLFWIANRRGAQTLRAAPVLPDGNLAVPSEIASGTFRDIRVMPIATGIAVSWIDDATDLLHGLTAQCP